MKRCLSLLSLCLLAASVPADVRVFVVDANGVAAIKYECTAGEVVRGFALDVRVDRGEIIAVTNFFRGPSTAQAQGYGIFPAAFRDHVMITSGTNANWEASNYTPLAAAVDSADTLPGLNSSGVTLEFGALWDPAAPATQPSPAGTLCTLQLNKAAQVSVAANLSRGGVTPASSEAPVTVVFTGAQVGPAITRTTLDAGILTVNFKGGELETTTALNTNQWTATGNTSGVYTETLGGDRTKYYRVRR
jgi:hypothetical protein